MPTFTFNIPSPTGQANFSINGGSSLLFVGANGCGKTRLAVKIEDQLQLKAHRISAQRALNLNPSVPKINEVEAINGLRTGHAQKGAANVNTRFGSRWAEKSSTYLLNDFDLLIQALFADQSNKALETHNRVRANIGSPATADANKFEKLKGIWERLLPKKKLIITGDDIQVLNDGTVDPYKAEDMSDGERAIFYLVGQTLCADIDSVIIFDEPEIHIHRSIMAKLWDELEAARPDCAFIFISHDLEFVASRVGEKYLIDKYAPEGTWEIEKVPEETGFSEEVTTKILGSRRPILFVEGTGTSLDFTIYRTCYPMWTVLPRGSCEAVIHSVVTMRANATLTRITCAGIVDADAYSPAEIAYLSTLGIRVLPVSEIENLFVVPEIAEAIGHHLGYSPENLTTRLQAIKQAVFANVQQGDNLTQCIARYCRRRIDRTLKKIDLSSAQTIAAISALYLAETGGLNIQAIADTRTHDINASVTSDNIKRLLTLYDNKSLLNIVAQQLKGVGKKEFESWIIRILRKGTTDTTQITQALNAVLPTIIPQ